MKKIIAAAILSSALLALSACGSSDSASEKAEADTVEIPADEAMSADVQAPVADDEGTSESADDASEGEEASADGEDPVAAAAKAAEAAAADAAAAASAPTTE